MPETPLIPRQTLFGNPDRAMVRLSPDGQRLAFLAPLDGVLNVWVAPADRPEQAQPITRDTGRGIQQYVWAYTNDHILYLKDNDGDENWRVFSVQVDTQETVDLTPFEGVQAQISQLSPEFPQELVVGLNDRDPQLHDLYRIDIATGERELLVQNDEGFLGYLCDHQFRVRFALRFTPEGGVEMYQSSDGAEDWTLYDSFAGEDVLTTNPVGLDAEGTTLYMIDSRGRDTAAAVAIDLETNERHVLATDDRADASDALTHPRERTVQAIAFNYKRKEWQIVDERVRPDLEHLNAVEDGEVEVVSRTLDDDQWIVAYARDDGPVHYYRYRRDAQTAEFLFTNQEALEGQPLARMHPVVIASRDGLNLVSYLTLPPDRDLDGDGRPDEPLPLVLYVHGGPWARDAWGYHPYHQWLANRGYAALSVNYRGSTGFGKSFINAADREWAGAMHDDLVDAVEWAVEERIADPDRVGIMGGSYGGFATLVGLTFTPDKFACGVDIVGPSSLITLMENVPPYWMPMFPLLTQRVGDPNTDEGREFLQSRSPLTYVDHIRKPLLIGQGANDPRVKQHESDQIVDAMQAKGIPVTYVLYPDEGHGFVRPENRLSFTAIAEAFLAEHLGGRVEPLGDDLEGSSIRIPTGADGLEGLQDALSAISG